MTRADVIRMAREAGAAMFFAQLHADALQRFAALVAAAEREACAKVCESMWGYGGDANDFAQAILSSGKPEPALKPPPGVMDALEADYRARGKS